MSLDDFLGKAWNTMGDKLETFRENNIKIREECENMSDERLIRQFASGYGSAMKKVNTKHEIECRGLQREALDALHHRKRY